MNKSKCVACNEEFSPFQDSEVCQKCCDHRQDEGSMCLECGKEFTEDSQSQASCLMDRD